MNPCVYCGAPWPDEVLDIDHRPECPMVTNLYPARAEDVEPHGFGCLRCGEQFAIGDYYSSVPHADDDGHTSTMTVEVVCLSCAWAAELERA